MEGGGGADGAWSDEYISGGSLKATLTAARQFKMARTVGSRKVEKEVTGTVAADVSLSSLGDVLAEYFPASSRIHAFLWGPDRGLLASSHNASLVEDAPGAAAMDSPDPYIRAAATYVMENGPGNGWLDILGARYYINTLAVADGYGFAANMTGLYILECDARAAASSSRPRLSHLPALLPRRASRGNPPGPTASTTTRWSACSAPTPRAT